jgi:subtilisin family serine protease
MSLSGPGEATARPRASTLPIAALILLASPGILFAQATRIEPVLNELVRPALRAEILTQALIDPLAAPETLPLGGALALQRVGTSGTTMLGVFVRTGGPAGIAAIQAAGGDVGAVLGDYVSARIPLAAIEQLAASPDIVAIEAARALRMENDSGTYAVGADRLRTLVDGRWEGAIGENAIIGVYDTGLDFEHEDFIDEDGLTRVVGLWDQTQSGDPPTGQKIGNYCSPSDIQMAIQTSGTSGCGQRDFHGHGTHVAGSAAGDGSAGAPSPDDYPFAGVAPGAKLLIVNGGPGVFFEDRIIDGLKWMRDEGRQLGMPVVVNLSLGGQFGAHDGSRLYERMIDSLSGPGFVVVVAAGNAGVNRNTTPVLGGPLIHARGFPTGTQATEFTFEVPMYTPNADACNGNRISMSLWYEALDSLLIELVRPDGTSASQVRGQAVLAEGAAGRIIIDNGSAGPNGENGDIEAAITINGCGTSGVPSAGTWRIRVTPTSTGSGQPWDMWIWQATGPQPEGRTGFDNRLIVGSPGNAHRAITVGAFVTKLCWQSASSANPICYSQQEALGDLARFSGGGPTRDARIKPEIAAPGIGVMSSQSHDGSISTQRLAPDNRHAVREGTSMAAPHVAGAVAIMLSQNGSLTPEEVRAAIAASAVADVFTTRTYDAVSGAAASDWWGHGKLDVPALLTLSDGGPATLAVDTEPATSASPVPGGRGTRLPLLRLTLEAQGFESIDVTAIGFDVSGNDAGARLVLLRDDGDGTFDAGDTEVGSAPASLAGTLRRVVIQPASLRVAPFTPLTVFAALELSGQAPNGATFEATLAPAELHTLGTTTGEVDRIEAGVVAVTSGPATTTVLAQDELLSFSQNPVGCWPRSNTTCADDVIFNFARSPVRAAVYTVTGRRVIDLCATSSLECGGDEGPTFTRWDLRNDNGEPVAPGVYLVIFDVAGQVFREKLMILTPGTDPDPQEQQS